MGIFTLTESSSLAPTFAFIALETDLQAFASKAREEQRGREAVLSRSGRAEVRGSLHTAEYNTQDLSLYYMYVHIYNTI